MTEPLRPATEPVPSEAEEHAVGWLLRASQAHDGVLLGDAARDHAAWLAADPAHGRAMARMRDVWQALDELPTARVETWKALARASTGGSVGPAPTLPSRRRFAAHALMAGAGCAVVGSGAWWLLDQQRQQATFTQAYRSQRGQLMDLRLPDGSQLKLDTDTELQVALYRDRREVQLVRGQAMFSVAADAARPFHVEAAVTRVTVVGTRFEVRHVGEAVAVQVEEGRVCVARRVDPDAAGARADGVLLGAGESVQADAHGRLSAVLAVAPAAIAPWRSGRLSFDDLSLAEALAEFARYGDTRIVVRDPAVAALRVTGSFEISKSASFAQALPQVLPVRLIARVAETEIVAR